MAKLNKREYRIEVVRPVWMPFNDVAQTIVESLVNKFNYPTTGPKAEKYAVMIASIIKAAQTLPKQSEGRKPKYLGVSFGSKNWSRFPLVGREVAVKVVKEVLEYLEASQVAGSGKNWHQDETGKWYLDPKMSMYNINLQRLLIVKVRDAKVTAKVFRQVIHDYCQQLSGLEVLVPLSVTVPNGSSRDLLPSDNDLEGTYLN